MFQHGKTVIRLRRPAIFGREPIIDRDEFRAGEIGDLGANGMMALKRTDHKTAAMKIEQNGARDDFARSVAPDRDALNHTVRKDHIRGERSVEARAKSIVPMPLLFDRRLDRIRRIKSIANCEKLQDALFGGDRRWSGH